MARQLGLATSRQLKLAGLTESRIEFRVETRRLLPIYRGVYRSPAVSPWFEQTVLAACLATGGVASHRCAAVLFGLRGFERRKVIEITVQRRRAPRLEGVEAHTTKRLDTTKIGVIPVTTPAQTLLDLAAVEPRLAEGALNDALRRQLVRLPGLVRFLQGVGRSGRPGVARLRELVENQIKGKAPTESWLEDRVLEFLRAQRLPEPERQFWLRLPNGRRIRFDFAHPPVKLAIEADGRLWHTTPSDVRRDRERDQMARLLGWNVVRVTWLDLQERPIEIAAQIATPLGFNLVAA
jgi:very-short-patch-repair endonuclease